MRNITYLLSLIFLFCACSYSGTKGNEAGVGKKGDADIAILEGYWLMSDYIDSVLVQKSIEYQTRKELAAAAIILNVTDDSVAYSGLLYGEKKVRLLKNYDSLSLVKAWATCYRLFYDSTSNSIKAISSLNTGKEKDSLVYTYRRIRQGEQFLVEGIEGRQSNEKLASNFNKLFCDSLIVGQYIPLDKNLQPMSLKSDGRLEGFKHFNQYRIHDYFGTHHPFRPEDVLTFVDTTWTNQINALPINYEIYSWKFKSDTLFLTPMQTDDNAVYYKGTETHQFVKK